MTLSEMVVMTTFRHVRRGRKWRKGAEQRMRNAVKALPFATMTIDHIYSAVISVIRAERTDG